MNAIGDCPPFSEQHEFVARIVGEREILLANVHAIVRFSLTRDSHPEIYLLGTSETYARLRALWNKATLGLRLESVPVGESLRLPTIACHDVYFETLQGRNWPAEYAPHLVHVVARARAAKVIVQRRRPASEVHNRWLRFMLAGPQRFWGLAGSHERSYTGDVKIRHLNSELDCGVELPFRVGVYWHFEHEATEAHRRQRSSIETMAVQCEVLGEPGQLSDDTVNAQAEDLVEDLALLVSVMSRRWVRWYRRDLEEPGLFERLVRRTSECSTDEPQWDEGPVETSRARDFIKTALPRFRELRTIGIDLRPALVYYVSGSEARTVEGKFSYHMFALERLRDTFRAKDDKRIAPQWGWLTPCLPRLTASLQEAGVPPGEILQFQRRVNELNQPTMRQALVAMCEELGTDWRDLYPPGEPFTLLRTRATLFHSARAIEPELLWRETERLRALVERILLGILGWRHSLSPAAHTLTWLNNPTAGRMGAQPDLSREGRVETVGDRDSSTDAPHGE